MLLRIEMVLVGLHESRDDNTVARSESDRRTSTHCSSGANTAHGTNPLMRQKLTVKCFMTQWYLLHTHTCLNPQTFRQ